MSINKPRVLRMLGNSGSVDRVEFFKSECGSATRELEQLRKKLHINKKNVESTRESDEVSPTKKCSEEKKKNHKKKVENLKVVF